MGVMDSARHHGQEFGGVAGCKKRLVTCQATALDQLHAEVLLPLVFTDLVDRQDVVMIEVGRCFGLSVEALYILG